MSQKPTEAPQAHPQSDPASEDASILKPIMDDLKGITRPAAADEVGAPEPAGPGHPPQPAELDQDPGSGYNPDGTYPKT